jgi:polar amino acid transport system permease protein
MDLAAILIDWFPFLLTGILATLGLVFAALAVGFVIGLPAAIGQVYGSRTVRSLIGVYVWFFRGLPLLVLLFLFYFGIFPAIGLGDVSPFVVGALVLGLHGGAYQAEIFRGAFLSIGEGQMTAARTLGMSRTQAIRHVILPQALLIALPGWSNEYPTVLTDTSICYAIGVAELLTRASVIVSTEYIAMPIYLARAGVYLVLNYTGMKALNILERRVSVPGFQVGSQ